MPHVATFARALYQLHAGGLLRESACKDAVKMFIRRSTETTHFHATSHYRSAAAAQLLAQQPPFRSPGAYQAFCRRNLRHEHMVPGEVIYRLIVAEGNTITEARLADTLRRFGLRATITRDEDDLLTTRFRHTMPAEFWTANSPLAGEPLARYIVTGIAEGLRRRTADSWLLES